MSGIIVYAFGPDWGLPTTGPFALKLLAWLSMNGISHDLVAQNNPRKGPRGKSPWVEIDGQVIADSDAIIAHLAADRSIELPHPAASARTATAAAFKTAFEERFHQILEWELFMHPAGAAYIRGAIASEMPPLVAGAAFGLMQRHFARQLHARGIARHAPAHVADMGRAELDGLAVVLQDRPFLDGAEPGLNDLAVFGQTAPMLAWPMRTPVADHAKTLSPLRRWCDDVGQRALGLAAIGA